MGGAQVFRACSTMFAIPEVIRKVLDDYGVELLLDLEELHVSWDAEGRFYTVAFRFRK